MKRFIALALGLALALVASAQPTFTVTLNWQAPTTNTDGTPLTNLAGYTVYYSTQTRPALCIDPVALNPAATPAQQAACTAWVTAAGKVEVNSANATSQVLTNAQLTGNTAYFFAAAARNTPGTRSGFSNQATATTPDIRVPGAPTNVTVTITFNAT